MEVKTDIVVPRDKPAYSGAHVLPKGKARRKGLEIGFDDKER